MKLSFGVLAALAGVNEAAVTCTGNKQLFEASCDKNGFTIKINEACRAEGFGGIDFPNSFVWGLQTVNTMAVPGCTAPCTATDVVTGASETCTTVKPATGATDSDSAATYQWVVPFGNCAIAAPAVDTADNLLKYYLYFNSNSVADGANAISQMEQVKFTCKIGPFQEDSGAVTISAGDMVDDANAVATLDLTSLVTLGVSTLSGDTAGPNTAATVYNGDTAMLSGMAAATTANLGDHVELRLNEVTAGTPSDTYALSLYRCWASKDTKAATVVGTETLTGADTALEFEFWDEFCPKYNWVAPESGATTGNGYLKTHWDRATPLKAINFRQFAFLDTNFNIGSDSITYHCYIKVCMLADAATCSTTKLDASAVSCTAPTYYDPSGRRRREADRERTRRSEADGTTLVEMTKTVNVPTVAAEDCHTIVNGVCVVQKDERSQSSGTKQVAAATGLAAFLAAINL